MWDVLGEECSQVLTTVIAEKRQATDQAARLRRGSCPPLLRSPPGLTRKPSQKRFPETKGGDVC